jgi:hypothetical protein
MTLLEGRMLNDKYMNGYGLLLNKQFPQLPKPQSTLYAQNITKIQPAKQMLIFFHFYCTHWVLSHCREGNAYVYDSLQGKTLHPDLKKQLVALYGETDVELVPLQVQSAKQDCGVWQRPFYLGI